MKLTPKQISDSVAVFGGQKLDGIWGEKKFASCDGKTWWSDGGISDIIGDHVRDATQTAIADNVRDAMVENVKDGQFELAVYKGKIYVVFDMSNGPNLPLKAHVDLSAMFASAIDEANDGGEDGRTFKLKLADALIEIADVIRRKHNGSAVDDEPEIAPVSRKRKIPDISEPDLDAAMGRKR